MSNGSKKVMEDGDRMDLIRKTSPRRWVSTGYNARLRVSLRETATDRVVSCQGH